MCGGRFIEHNEVLRPHCQVRRKAYLPDDHGAVDVAAGEDVEDDGGEGEDEVHRKGDPVAKGTIEAQRSLLGAHDDVAVDEREDGQETKRLVDVLRKCEKRMEQRELWQAETTDPGICSGVFHIQFPSSTLSPGGPHA